MARILVVEDDATVREVVVSYLTAAGHDPVEAGDGESGLSAAREMRPDLVVLDLMLPGVDGMEVHRRLSSMWPQEQVPVVMLTALGTEQSRVAGLEAGADDYVTKPFSPRELVLRVDSILRRSATRAAAAPVDVLIDADLVVDRTRQEAALAGEVLPLTVREFELLAHLVSRPGEALTREQLLEEVWGWTFGDTSTVTVHVRRLREKVELDPRQPTRLVTVWGVGYRWETKEIGR
ncbi:MAG: response regulator transcription factor [Nocardioides sp.]|nr:response regulator transcription factor [Nocardioides sp.]